MRAVVKQTRQRHCNPPPQFPVRRTLLSIVYWLFDCKIAQEAPMMKLNRKSKPDM
ncbi:hypothetical protein M419DRAFT_119450 [Trichoderma reesei RUT C-30]|uniref:Uncharacterized protein n=1 Tax=Hypocrea jecorina (strain ATCC 56765 / BCRC 32924 / NRRL 11460 / Rut C-30) TaxID=1344414 RepID=A0A024S661_HYPJR|nr:hypothetical protein M419DRAFT_119450 [Trichoderma reesei RUT C-30]